ncbi:MAG: transposase [Dehalococcoidia bacterium]|nr:transposase [Dehalococcoidia bacterium]
MEKWQERGLAIANSNTVEKNKLGWKVPSQSGNGTYVVNLDHGEPFCTCQHFENTHKKCQHIYAVEFIVQKEKRPDGTEVITKTMRVTYGQDWINYNAAQTHEQERFVTLLRDLCNGIQQPEYKFGRPRLPLADVIFGLVFKSYTMMSGRRFMTDLREAEAKELVTKSPSFTSTFRYLENPELTPLLKALIEQSASPLRAVETDFAVDSSGFATSTYDRWFDHKWGKMRSEVKWIKTHLMCGVKTHIVTSIEATPTETADAPQLPELVKTTAKAFAINEISADKAYSSRRNLHAINAVNAVPFIPFKSYSKGSQGAKPFDGLWHRMWHFYNYNREAFLEHYHKRSNAETVFSMIKMKFGGAVRSKTPVAQVNEVLCKVLCHNICVLIQSIYELGLEPTFWTLEVNEPIVPKALTAMR